MRETIMTSVRMHPDNRHFLVMESQATGVSINRLINEAVAERYGIKDELAERRREEEDE